MPHTRAWATAQKTRTLTTTCASVCRACCSRPTETTSWKRRNNLPLTARFQLVENTLNGERHAQKEEHAEKFKAYIQDIPNRKDCSGCLLTKALMRQRRNECAEFDGQSTGSSLPS